MKTHTRVCAAMRQFLFISELFFFNVASLQRHQFEMEHLNIQNLTTFLEFERIFEIFKSLHAAIT
jgi:hypothetical protein